MPKNGLDKKTWERRLSLFGNGDYMFGWGQHPPTNSIWAKKIVVIKQWTQTQVHITC